SNSNNSTISVIRPATLRIGQGPPADKHPASRVACRLHHLTGQKYGHSPPYQQPCYAAVAFLVRYGPVPGRSCPARSTVPEPALATCTEPAMALRSDLADGIGGAAEPTTDLRSGAGDHRPGPQAGGPGHVPVQRVRRAARLPAPVVRAGRRADPRPRESPG